MSKAVRWVLSARFVCLLALSVSWLFIAPGTASAVSRVAYLKPDGPGDRTGHQVLVGERWQAVDEDPHDGDLSYIFHHTGTGSPRQAVTTFSMQNSTPGMQTIQSATCEIVAWQSSASEGEFTCATISDGGSGCGSPTSYTRLTSQTVPGPLLPQELDGIQCGVESYCDALICAGREFRTTQVRLRVAYDDGVPTPTPTPVVATPTPTPGGAPAFCVDWSETEPFTIRRGETRTVPVKVKNCGTATWNATGDSLNYRGWWSDPGYSTKVDSSALGTPLSEPVPGGGTLEADATVRAPQCVNQATGLTEPCPAGFYYLSWDIFRSDGGFGGFFFSGRYHTDLGDLEIQVLELNGDPPPTTTPTRTPFPTSTPGPTVTPTRFPPTPTPNDPCTEDFGSCENGMQGVHPNFNCCSTWCETLVDDQPGRCVSPPTAPENKRVNPPPPQSEPGSAYTHPGGKLSAGAPAAGTCDPESISAGYTVIHECGDVLENVRLGGNIVPENPTNGTCLRPRVNDVTIDGCGRTIELGQGLELAVSILQKSNVTVKNLNTRVLTETGEEAASPIQIYGDWADGAALERSTVGRIVVLGADDVRIERSVAESIELGVLESSSQCDGGQECTPQGAVVWSNELTSETSSPVFRIRGGEGCVRGDHLILDNTIQGSSGIVLQMICSTNNTVARNTLQNNTAAKTIHLRDSTFNNLFEDNIVRQMVDSGLGPLSIQSGWRNSYHPSYNVFRRNDFLHYGAGPAIHIGAECARGNRFEDNVFRNNADLGSGTPGTANLKGRDNVFRNNTFYRTGPGTVVHLEYPTQNAGGDYVESCADPGEPPNQFVNNIIGSGGDGVMIYSQEAQKYRGNYNLFYDADGTPMFRSSQWNPYPFATWKERTWQDGESFEEDPRFEDESGDDFRLQAGSPALGSGEGGSDIGAQR